MRSRDYDHIYSSKRWAHKRRKVLLRDPVCVHCLRDGPPPGQPMQQSAEVDHINEIRDGGDIWDEDNLQGLCGYHHKRKTRQTRAERAKDFRKRTLGKY